MVRCFTPGRELSLGRLRPGPQTTLPSRTRTLPRAPSPPESPPICPRPARRSVEGFRGRVGRTGSHSRAWTRGAHGRLCRRQREAPGNEDGPRGRGLREAPQTRAAAASWVVPTPPGQGPTQEDNCYNRCLHFSLHHSHLQGYGKGDLGRPGFLSQQSGMGQGMCVRVLRFTRTPLVPGHTENH